MLPRPPMATKKNHAALKLLFAVVCVALLAGCKPPGPKALHDGKRLLEQGRALEAIERLQVATELLRTNAQAWNYLGVAYHQAGQWTNATAAYNRALLASPDLMEARLNLGALHLELGRAAEAKSQFTAYTLSRPNAAEGFQRLASAELQLRETAIAELHARKSLQLDDASAEAWNTLGLIQLQRARPRDAAQSFTAALQKRSLCRLLIATLLRDLDAAPVGLQRFVQNAAFGECDAQQFPRRGVIRIQLEGALEMEDRDPDLAKFEIFAAEAEPQQRGFPALRQQFLEIGNDRF